MTPANFECSQRPVDRNGQLCEPISVVDGPCDIAGKIVINFITQNFGYQALIRCNCKHNTLDMQALYTQ